MKDCIGRDIVAGNDIVYPVRKGFTVKMGRMKVFYVNSKIVKGYSPTGRTVTLQNVENAVVVDIPKPDATGAAAATGEGEPS